MSRLIAWTTAVMLSLLLLPTPGRAEDDKPPTTTAVKGAKPAAIDGVVSTDEYPSAALTMNQTPDRATIEGAPATAHVFHDEKTLFVAVTVPFKPGSELTKGETWGSDDGAEVCFRDASGADQGPTFIIHGFVTAKHECTTDGGAEEAAVAKLDQGVQFVAKVDKGSWTGEWAIPFTAAGLKYKPGLKLGFNLGALRSESGEWIIWRGAQGATHQLDSGGILILE